VLGVALAIRPLGVFFLKMRGIGQDDPRKVGSGGRAEDAALETLRDEPREVASVIEVRVSEDDGRDRIGLDRKGLPVAIAHGALEEAAVNEQPLAVQLEQVFGPGDSAGSAEAGQGQ
jgi:hypothetical protein